MEKIKKICIDTDVLIDIAKRKLVRYVSKELGIFITFITLYEYLRGLAYLGRDIKASKEELESKFSILWPSNEALLKLSEIYQELRRRGKLIPDPDLLIASLCIANNIPLSTYNVKHYSRLTIFGLKLVNPEEVIERIKSSITLY